MKTVAGKVAVALAVVAMVAVNALANILPINGVQTGQVSDGYPTFFVPAGYVFSIWGLIYAALLAFTAAQAFSRSAEALVAPVRALFVASCVANAAWIVCWHHYRLGWSVAVMLALLATLAVTYRRLMAAAPRARGLVRWTITAPFSLYLAWICVATIANVSALLLTLGWDGAPLAGQTWATIMMVVAAGLITALSVTREDAIPPLVLAWALAGIAVKFPDQPSMRVAGFTLGAAMVGLSVALVLRRRRPVA